jgi:hypothetical protein
MAAFGVVGALVAWSDDNLNIAVDRGDAVAQKSPRPTG